MLEKTNKHNIWTISNWKEHVEKIKENGGIWLNNFDSTKELIKINITSDINNIVNDCKELDVLIYLVKGPKTRESILQTKKLLKNNVIFYFNVRV
jgi:hypothetical protein